MPQTNPFHSLVPRKMTSSELVRALRLDLEAELDAINLYASHIDATDDEDARRVIRHVMNEEKEHAVLFFELIKRLDPTQAEQALKADAKVRMLIAGASDEEVEAMSEGEGARGMPERPAARLTVGELRNKSKR